jgi:hypothetical protein
MSETSPSTGVDDDIEIQQAHDGRWAWVDEAYDGAGTRVIEWIDVIDLDRKSVEVGGVEHLRFNDNEFDGDDGTPSETRWIQSSHWYDLEEVR